MRKQMLATITVLYAMVLVAGAQTPGTGAAGAALEKVSVVHGETDVRVEMFTRGTVTPKVETLGSPQRVVVDLPNTTLATAMKPISVGDSGVSLVRIGTAGAMTRVVVELEGPRKYEWVSGPADKLTLKFKRVEESASSVAVPKPAQDFVVLDPSYTTKQEAASAEAPARAVEAASKFVERPEGNLLPTPSGAMGAQAQTPAQPGSPIEPAVNLAAEQKSKPQAASVITKYTGEPISVNLKDVDLKDFFRLIHEISGLNVVLDPDVKGTLTIVLDDVPWDQALDIVLKNNSLARQLDGNVLRIAGLDTLRREAEARRAQQEAEALSVDKITVTRFLSYAHSKDVLATVKKFLSQRGTVDADERTNAIIINDIPSVMSPVDRLLSQLDRKTQEVEIEARVVAATRSFARDI
ncbi:MAG: AMIN domain-containing protein, partial [Acidobacteria bacterium]|nr:AMIN domain-containing protein [Acidobacteriota bacterium]